MTIQAEDLREQVARIVENYIYVGDDGELRGVEDAIGLVVRLISSTKGGGDQLSGNPGQLDGSTAGWALVPVDASDEMMWAGVAAALANPSDCEGRTGHVQIRAAYDAMIAAAPPSNIARQALSSIRQTGLAAAPDAR